MPPSREPHAAGADAAFLGVDIGTSGVKALLMRADGDVLATSTVALRMSTPRPGWAEQDPDDWWRAAGAAIQQLTAAHPGIRVAAVGLSGQQHSSVFLDAHGEVIRPALLWCDGRTTAECREVTERAGGEEGLRELVGNAALEGFTLPKVLWLRRHEPAAFARLRTVLLAKDYVRYRLTGVPASEPSDASGTLLFDTARRRWSDAMFTLVDLPRSLVPDLGESAEILGRVTGAAAAVTGLATGTPVVGGGGDNACGAAGVGAVAAGQMVASWGTSGTVLSPTDEPRIDPRMRAHTFCHVAPGRWYLIGVVLSAGSAFAWFRDQFARGYADTDEANRVLREEAASVGPGADGVTFLPYLQGERTPHRDASLRGAFLGLSLAHTRAHLARAVLEGVCFALRDSLEILRELGVTANEMLLTGGGAKYALLRQLQADVFGMPVATVNREEGSAYGAALLAAVGAGAFPDLDAAASATVRRSAPHPPDPDARARYEPLYARFRLAYEQAGANLRSIAGGENAGSAAR